MTVCIYRYIYTIALYYRIICSKDWTKIWSLQHSKFQNTWSPSYKHRRLSKHSTGKQTTYNWAAQPTAQGQRAAPGKRYVARGDIYNQKTTFIASPGKAEREKAEAIWKLLSYLPTEIYVKLPVHLAKMR